MLYISLHINILSFNNIIEKKWNHFTENLEKRKKKKFP